jgi:hypothetical protein
MALLPILRCKLGGSAARGAGARAGWRAAATNSGVNGWRQSAMVAIPFAQRPIETNGRRDVNGDYGEARGRWLSRISEMGSPVFG